MDYCFIGSCFIYYSYEWNFILQVHFVVYLVLLSTQVSRACLLHAFSS